MRCRRRPLGESREEVDGLLPSQDVERWKQNDLDFDDLPAEQKECSAKPPRRGWLMSSLQEIELRLRGQTARRLAVCDTLKTFQ
ncbi:unnamed protein product [Prunus brigantina]